MDLESLSAGARLRAHKGPNFTPLSGLMLVLFASGDFAFNLYWQSLMIYLLFYQTETLRVPISQAAEWYFIASVWDGIASMAVAVYVDRYLAARRYRTVLLLGAVPLAVSFIGAYSQPPWAGFAPSAWLLVSQILLRTAYAAVNVPYLAMSARIGADSRDRSLVAGLRMIFGAAAAVVVAFGTVPLGRLLSHSDGAPAFRSAAMMFAIVASLLLMAVGAAYHDAAPPKSMAPGSIRQALVDAWRNRAFVTLSAAMVVMIVAATMLDKSILYYFKYAIGDQASGQTTLAVMAAISVIALPVWIAVSRRIGVRAVWFIAVALGAVWLLLLAVIDLHWSRSVQFLLVLTQSAIVGLNFAVWAMLPDAIEYGQRATGVRVEAVLYGYVALLQRVAIGLGALLLGGTLGRGDLFSATSSASGVAMSFRLTMALIPIGLLLASAALMRLNPLKFGARATRLQDLES